MKLRHHLLLLFFIGGWAVGKASSGSCNTHALIACTRIISSSASDQVAFRIYTQEELRQMCGHQLVSLTSCLGPIKADCDVTLTVGLNAILDTLKFSCSTEGRQGYILHGHCLKRASVQRDLKECLTSHQVRSRSMTSFEEDYATVMCRLDVEYSACLWRSVNPQCGTDAARWVQATSEAASKAVSTMLGCPKNNTTPSSSHGKDLRIVPTEAGSKTAPASAGSTVIPTEASSNVPFAGAGSGVAPTEETSLKTAPAVPGSIFKPTESSSKVVPADPTSKLVHTELGSGTGTVPTGTRCTDHQVELCLRPLEQLTPDLLTLEQLSDGTLGRICRFNLANDTECIDTLRTTCTEQQLDDVLTYKNAFTSACQEFAKGDKSHRSCWKTDVVQVKTASCARHHLSAYVRTINNTGSEKLPSKDWCRLTQSYLNCVVDIAEAYCSPGTSLWFWKTTNWILQPTSQRLHCNFTYSPPVTGATSTQAKGFPWSTFLYVSTGVLVFTLLVLVIYSFFLVGRRQTFYYSRCKGYTESVTTLPRNAESPDYSPEIESNDIYGDYIKDNYSSVLSAWLY